MSKANLLNVKDSVTLTYFSFPQNLIEWKLGHIDELIKLKDIEGVDFDFKSKNLSQGKGLATHICAMSNVIGGYIVLGVDEYKENGVLIGFKKNGFSIGEEDKVKQSVFNCASQIEPLPNVDISSITENDSKTFYYVIKILSIDNNKPYFLKNTKLCYIRMGNRSEPADRFTILNLYSKFEEKRKDFSYLKTAISQLKEDFSQTIHEINLLNENSITNRTILTTIDTKIVKGLMIKVDWQFFGDTRYLLGETTIGETQKTGFYHYLKKIEKINIYIKKFNSLQNVSDKYKIIETLQGSSNYLLPQGQGTKEIMGQLDVIVSKIDIFLNKI